MAIKENVNINTKTSEKRGLSKFFRELKAEVKRITWPSKDDTKKSVNCSRRSRTNIYNISWRVRLYFYKPL